VPYAYSCKSHFENTQGKKSGRHSEFSSRSEPYPSYSLIYNLHTISNLLTAFDWAKYRAEKKPEQEQQKPEQEQQKPDQRKSDRLYQTIDRLDTWINTAADNGLFIAQNTVKYEDIQNKLNESRKSLTSQKYCESEYNLSLALSIYSRALYSASRLWRFSNVYAGPIWIYWVGILFGIFTFYYFSLDINISQKFLMNVSGKDTAEAAINATAWGCIGSVLRGIWYLKSKIDDRVYRNSWRFWAVSVPFLGGIFGAIIYLVIIAGLYSLNGKVQTNALVVVPLAALAGFNWEWGVKIFERIGEILTMAKPTYAKKIGKVS
jgi:hypothetical protein